jgi:hypothetical protein
MAKPVLSSLDMGNAARILNLPDGASAQEPATVAQLNAAVEGLAWKDSCRVATQGNLNLAAPGATVDGISMSAGDRMLVRSQSAAAENGIYIWNGSAVAATRALDANSAAELEQAVTTVEEGTSAGASFRQTAVNFTLGSGSVAWATFGTSAAAATETTAGIAEVATQAETDAGTDDARMVTPLKLATWAARPKRFSQSIGDGSATQYDVTHGLGSVDCHVEVVRVSDGVSVWCDVTRTSTTVVRLNFLVAPTSNQYRVTVVA